MGSRFLMDENWAAILGHPFDASQTGVLYMVDQIAGVSVTGGTAKTKLGGSQVFGTSANYQIPAWARCIVAARGKQALLTPTANQAVLSTLKLESTDLGMKDWEVFYNPIDSGLGTNETQYQDASLWWPLMQPCNGGEQLQVFSTPQIANTAAYASSADLLLSDTWPEGYNGSWTGKDPNGIPYGVVQSKIAGINYGGGPTATGTGAASVATDGGLQISGPKKRLIGVVGALVGTTPAASKPISGQFAVTSSDIATGYIKFNAEPITGFLGTTTAGTLAHLAINKLNVRLNAATTLKTTFTLDTAITTAGNFETQYLYVDNP